ncbi:hypothetical protein BGX21_006858 [Mortierella sp. AD011]|nr:hypothetical protein BGX20_003280 [Mortierella sp. AD010]KAF9399067.1 hypothetical protein BGX21_006858 [Mortierella sp. AD011]
MSGDFGLETQQFGNLEDEFGGLEDLDMNSDSDSDTEDLITVEVNKEPSRCRLKTLETIVKMLLLSPAIEGKVNWNWVLKSTYVGD